MSIIVCRLRGYLFGDTRNLERRRQGAKGAVVVKPIMLEMLQRFKLPSSVHKLMKKWSIDLISYLFSISNLHYLCNVNVVGGNITHADNTVVQTLFDPKFWKKV